MLGKILAMRIKTLRKLIDDYNQQDEVNVQYEQFLENEKQKILNDYYKLFGSNIIPIDFTKRNRRTL